MDLRHLVYKLDSAEAIADHAERAKEARRLSDVALAELAAYGDEAVFQAAECMSRAEIADAMGVSVSSVNKALRRHKARIA
jgi:DNA-directed RNA polymerase specialized sigma24 family protein